jgi:hypothetical protein
MDARALLIEMFDRMVIAKDASLITYYYAHDFLLTTNGQLQDYASFAAGHHVVYATPITYDVRYDDEAWVTTDDRVGARVWITTSRPGEQPTEIEVVLVATVVNGKFHRMWELTWPDWSQVRAFDEYDTSTVND